MSAAANLQPPEALKQLKPYLTLATQLDQRDEKIVAYYCRLYSVQTGMQINRSLPECKKFLAHLMDILENTKKQHVGEEALTSDIVGQAVVEKSALKLFEKADDDDRQSRFNKNLVKQFYSAGLLFDVLNCFGDLSEDLVVKKQYAKRKAMYLNKCFQTGETPIPGPLVDDGYGEETGEDNNASGGAVGGAGASNHYQPTSNDYGGASSSNYPPSAPVDRPPSSRNDRPPSSNKNKQSPPSAPSHNQYYEPEEKVDIQSAYPHELMQKAQKFCKFASSALQYDDVDTAITNLEQCLALLKTTKRK
uniref:Predicted protein n=1 Tax=Hordeum vulgare subsp. vulgare TaxID=112509 RepID=F2DK36_HORVV|nr:predicted protein [Hordeum vulgare subsp. vulgare]